MLERYLRDIYEIISEMEGIDPVVLDMSETPIPTDYFVIVTVNSNVHMRSLRNRLVNYIKSTDLPLIYYDKGEGYDWLLIDAGDIVVHVFTEHGRSFYDLEGLWVDAKKIEFPVLR